ncbi:MAG: carbohydrate binding domain-containing protein [Pedobacter sp.]|uniref:carbohydrate binding domain-containing protein n=1 Tax=Pedobacter sp. TaxID=1411316 RepID=UPI002806CFEE|nr:carbohydrate binding domain-containing protein [Pedobacter sp.]MDQ8006137.1 carbohydrate binding domain-containing protein [Pedobacter sp.]
MKKQLLKKGMKMLFLTMALAGNAIAQNLLNVNPGFEDGSGSGPNISLGGVWYRTIDGSTTGAANQIYRKDNSPAAQQGSAYLEAITPSGATYNASYKLQAVNNQSLNGVLTVGNTYKLSFYYQNSAGHSFKVGLQDNAGKAPYSFFTTVNTEATGWTLHEYSFTVTSDLIAAGNDVRVMLQFGADAGTTRIDNVQLINTTPVASGSNVLLNHSFESGAFSGWTNYGSTAVTEATTGSQDGSKHVKVTVAGTGGNAWDIQFLTATHFSVVPGHQYRVSFWYKADKTFNFMLQNAKTVSLTVNAPVAVWTKYEATMTVPIDENTSTSLKFHFNTGAGTVELDNMSVVDLTALPVTLSSFSAKANANSIAVNWKTETETDASHFELLRAGEDGNFKYLTKVSAKNTASTYNFSDAKPLKGINYYKLLQYDIDGKVNEIKEIASAKFDFNSTELALYPNPATGNFSFNLDSYAGKTISVQLTDLTGKTLKTETLNAVNGINTVSLPQALSAGLHFVKISGQNLYKTSKLMIK